MCPCLLGLDTNMNWCEEDRRSYVFILTVLPSTNKMAKIVFLHKIGFFISIYFYLHISISKKQVPRFQWLTTYLT
jgi:hypothetical protein